MAHVKLDNAFNECETAQAEELRAKLEQTELLRQFRVADLPLEDAGQSLASVRDALDRLFQMVSAD